ncbi:MAG TPA: hypothetical protein VMF89_17755 [Polyangiales bacterium]|nr:hypothetical protein [Polyangiales bacterium]
MPAPESRIAVVSGRYPASRFESYINHRAYCARHGYTYIYANWPTGERNRYLNKIRYIQAYYRLFDYIFWIDDDAFFLNLDQKLESFLPSASNFLSICASPDYKKLYTFVSSGQFAIRCDETGRAFLDAIPTVDLEQVRRWWTEDLGFFSNGDQDAMVYLMKTDPRFAGFERHPHTAFNSRMEDLVADRPVFILHFTGRAEIKQRNYARAQSSLRRGPSLLDPHEAKLWNLAIEPRITRRLANKVRSALLGR